MEIEIYTKRNCHLCEVMIKTVRECLYELKNETELKVTDIESDKDLSKYKLKIPVLIIDNKMYAKYSVDKEKLMRKLKNIS
ncbi:MAG TPA: glutaredoxin family protein [Ignavibacteria bacterium]|nr:glutaredoxin family protein [Ignavibacteria bacterium]HRK00167.1 glutaredoxin family protein [Ignavibacteria bacterium]